MTEVPDERALLVAVPLRHLEALTASGGTAGLLPAGGPGDLDAAHPGMPVLVMATDAGEAEVPAATWRATYVGRPGYEPGAPWPEGLPTTWVAEHKPVASQPAARHGHDGDDRDDWDDDEDWDEDEDDLGPQAFLAVEGLERLPRESWVFTNELVRKQARRGRSYRPRVPTIVPLPD